MEYILFYSLGVVTVIALALIVGAVRLQKRTVDLQHGVQDLRNQLELIHRTIEDKYQKGRLRAEEIEKRIDFESEAIAVRLYRTMDSRLDKLENKLITKK